MSSILTCTCLCHHCDVIMMTCNQGAQELELILTNALGAPPESEDPNNVYRHIFAAVGAMTPIDIYALTHDDFDSSLTVTEKEGDMKIHPSVTHYKRILGLAHFEYENIDLQDG